MELAFRARVPAHAPRIRRSDTTKYFGTELGAQTKFEDASGLAIVNGAHETGRLSQLLEGFIKRFVQCGQCNNPETEIVVTKKETIELQCKACGAVTQVDMRHKLCTFILKNPPVVKDKSKKCVTKTKQEVTPRAESLRSLPPPRLRRAEKERIKEGEALDKAEKDAKKSVKKEKKAGDAPKSGKKGKKGAAPSSAPGDASDASDDDSGSSKDGSGDGGGGDDVQWATDTSAAAAAARAAEQLTDAAAEMVTASKPAAPGGAAGGDGEAPPAEALASLALTGAATPAPHASHTNGGAKNGGGGSAVAAEGENGEEEEEEDHAASFRAFLSSTPPPPPADGAAFLRDLPLDGLEHRMHVLVGAAVTPPPAASSPAAGAPAPPPPSLAKQLAACAPLLGAVVKAAAASWPAGACAASPVAAQTALLAALERFLAHDAPPAFWTKGLSAALKALYDADVVEEPALLAWHDAPASARKLGVSPPDAAAVRKAAAVFVEWLRTADEDEEEEDE